MGRALLTLLAAAVLTSLLLLGLGGGSGIVQGQGDPTGTPTPTATPVVSLSIDADPDTPGVQSHKSVNSSTFTVDIVVQDLPRPLGGFGFWVVYDQTVMNAPTLGASVPPLDRNPDANQAYLNAGGSDFVCWGVSGDVDSDPNIGKAWLACDTSVGPGASGDGVLANLTFEAVAEGAGSLQIVAAGLGDIMAQEIGTCNPWAAERMECNDALIGLYDVIPFPIPLPTSTSTATPTATPIGTPAPQTPPAVRIDLDPGVSGIQTTRTISAGPFVVNVVVEGINVSQYGGLGLFTFGIVYDQRVINAPTLGPPVPMENRNPDLNEAFVNSEGADFTCVVASGDVDVQPTSGFALLSCSTYHGSVTGSGVLGAVTFNVAGSGSSELVSRDVLLGYANAVELGTCNPEIAYPLHCEDASITVLQPTPTLVPPTPTPTRPPGVGGTVRLPPAAVAAESRAASGDAGRIVGAYAALAGVSVGAVAIGLGGLVRRRGLQ